MVFYALFAYESHRKLQTEQEESEREKETCRLGVSKKTGNWSWCVLEMSNCTYRKAN